MGLGFEGLSSHELSCFKKTVTRVVCLMFLKIIFNKKNIKKTCFSSSFFFFEKHKELKKTATVEVQLVI